jgi:hypothetical protein
MDHTTRVSKFGVWRITRLLLITILAAGTMASSNAGCSTSVPSQIAETRPKTVDRPVVTPTPLVTDSPGATIRSGRLTVALDYFGIKSTHQITANIPNSIQLLAIVDDGNAIKQFSFPSSKEGAIIKDYSLQDLRSQIIYQTYAPGEYLKVSVLAYSCPDKGTALAVLDAFKSYDPHQASIMKFYDNLAQSKQLIGYYERTWSPGENWGASKISYQETAGDLCLWFRIWSTTGFPVISRPKFVPDVHIQSVTLPVAKVSYESYLSSDYSTTFKLVNNEPVDLTIDWQARSSTAGNFDGGKVLLRKGEVVDVTRSYHYTATGTSKLTYAISYNGVQLDSWSDNMKVTYYPDVTIQNVVLPANVTEFCVSHPNPYTTTFRLVNNEAQDMIVHWQMNTSILMYDGMNVLVPANSYRDITNQYLYRASGKDYITYVISYHGNPIDTWKGTLDIQPPPEEQP